MVYRINLGVPNAEVEQLEPMSLTAGGPGRLVRGYDGGHVEGQTKAQGVAVEFNTQLADLDRKIADKQAALDYLYTHDAQTGELRLKNDASGSTRTAEAERERISKAIAALQGTREVQRQVGAMRWEEAAAVDERPREAAGDLRIPVLRIGK